MATVVRCAPVAVCCLLCGVCWQLFVAFADDVLLRCSLMFAS